MKSKIKYKGKLPRNRFHDDNFRCRIPNKYDREFINNLLKDTKYKADFVTFYKKSRWNQDVEYHSDDNGMCLVYCISGEGDLYIGDKYIKLKPNVYTIFNDCVGHSMELVSNHCSTIVVQLDKLS